MPKVPTTKETTRKQSNRKRTRKVGRKNESSAVEPKKRRIKRKLSATIVGGRSNKH